MIRTPCSDTLVRGLSSGAKRFVGLVFFEGSGSPITRPPIVVTRANVNRLDF